MFTMELIQFQFTGHRFMLYILIILSPFSVARASRDIYQNIVVRTARVLETIWMEFSRGEYVHKIRQTQSLPNIHTRYLPGESGGILI